MTQDKTIHECLASYEGQELNIEELVEAANALLEALAPTQTRYKVKERADVRTIRYYTGQKLLPPPDGYAGGRARYSARHLSRLLLIKMLQAENHTLKKIKAMLSGASDDDVLARLSPASGETMSQSQERETPSTAQQSEGSTAMKRLTLSRGATLDIPLSVHSNQTELASLADELEAIAKRWRARSKPAQSTPDQIKLEER